MEGKAVFISKVINGRIAQSDKIRLALAKEEGNYVKITIQRNRKNRSTSQNNFYWGCVLPYIQAILRDAGHEKTIEQAHDFCKLEAVGNLTDLSIVVVHDETYIIPHLKTTTKLSTMEFEAYLERIRQWALEHAGVIIPLPNEELEQNYIEPIG